MDASKFGPACFVQLALLKIPFRISPSLLLSFISPATP